MKLVVHTMEYQGGHVTSSLQLFPVDCCGSEEELEHKKDKIYILEIDSKLIGSVAIYGNEIDDLIVKKDSQRIGIKEQSKCIWKPAFLSSKQK